MATTATFQETLKIALDNADLNKLASVLAQMDLGTMLTPLKLTKTGLTSASSFDLTSVAVGSNPAALVIGTLRVTAGAAAAGVRIIGDAGVTPSATVATISDDGKTVAFEAGVTAFVIEYIPRPAVDMNLPYARS
jgi:hypothetical protein